MGPVPIFEQRVPRPLDRTIPLSVLVLCAARPSPVVFLRRLHQCPGEAEHEPSIAHLTIRPERGEVQRAASRSYLPVRPLASSAFGPWAKGVDSVRVFSLQFPA